MAKSENIGNILILSIGGLFAWRMIRKEILTDNNKEIEILARTVYGEARGESPKGQQAVMQTILNRVKKGGWWGATIEDVCKKPYQFSCWNPETVGSTDSASLANYNTMMNADMTDSTYEYLYLIAKSSVENGGQLGTDYSNGATHYHAKSVSPSWANKLTKTAEIGSHIFYV